MAKCGMRKFGMDQPTEQTTYDGMDVPCLGEPQQP